MLRNTAGDIHDEVVEYIGLDRTDTFTRLSVMTTEYALIQNQVGVGQANTIGLSDADDVDHQGPRFRFGTRSPGGDTNLPGSKKDLIS